VRTRLAVGRVIVYNSGGWRWIRQGDPSLSTPLLNRAIVYERRAHRSAVSLLHGNVLY
jgi:hypothetical protein